MGIKVNDIAFVRFRVPDLDVMQVFLEEFGMQCAERTDDTLYMRGTDDEGFVHVAHLGAEAGFIGLAFEANLRADLDVLANHDEFSDVVELDGPGGGGVVRATDPNGFRVEVVAGRGSVGRLPVPAAAIRNDADSQPRKGARRRARVGAVARQAARSLCLERRRLPGERSVVQETLRAGHVG
ncbi:MAG: hypothetical protein JJD93_10480 [Ilumatobacteraceae bacterium]|nr:hypothetical protein [Ilumatobacteraceae bacterium]